MENKFVASSVIPSAYGVTFALLSLGFLVKGYGPAALVLFVLAVIFSLIFASGFRIYVITDNEFDTVNLFGSKRDCYLFDDMLKVYTLKGYQTYYRIGGGGSDYDAVILKIQMISGEIYEIDVEEVFSLSEFVNALRDKLGEHKFQVL